MVLDLKDLMLAQRMADKAKIHLPHLESTIRLYERLKAQGGAELDHSALHKWLWQNAGLSFTSGRKYEG